MIIALMNRFLSGLIKADKTDMVQATGVVNRLQSVIHDIGLGLGRGCAVRSG